MFTLPSMYSILYYTLKEKGIGDCFSFCNPLYMVSLVILTLSSVLLSFYAIALAFDFSRKTVYLYYEKLLGGGVYGA